MRARASHAPPPGASTAKPAVACLFGLHRGLVCAPARGPVFFALHMSGSPASAVFLSYASQDAGAVLRICDALRVAGVEVWFDQNELTGGDAWDAKIRKQIAECALFVPVISAATQPLREGPCRSDTLNPIVSLRDDPPLVQPNQTRPPYHRRALLRRSRGRRPEGLAAHDAAATPRRDGTLAADEPSEL
jgi:hypothetical protein